VAVPAADTASFPTPAGPLPAGTGHRPTPAQLLGVQRSAGNAAVNHLLRNQLVRGSAKPPALPRAVTPDTPDVAVQRDPPTPSNIAPLPGADTPPPPESGWAGFKALIDGSRKFRFGVGSHNLHRAQKSTDFSWSTKKPGPTAEAPLGLGVIPLPLPVGPILLEMRAGVSAYAGGDALLDIAAKDVILEATAADLMSLGQAAAYLLTPGLQVASLGLLASLRLKGTATLIATASASLGAGAQASLEAVANPAVWPVAGYVDGHLGANAKAHFEAPAQIELSLGSLHLTAGQTFRTFASITPEIGLNAGIAAGMILGYRPATLKHQLWSHNVNAGARKQLKVGVEGGNWATLNTAGDGPPVIDMEKILLNGKALVEALFAARDAANDTVDPNPPATDPRVSAQGIGQTQVHGAKPPSNRLGPKLLWTESEHIIPFATGKRLWDVIGLVVPGRGGHEDRGQTTVMIYYEAARFKTSEDNRISDAFEAKLAGSSAETRMRRARLHIDAGHPEAARADARAVLGLVTAGLRAARDDAVERTNQSIVRESNLRMDGNQLTNAERRGPQGQPEDALPYPARVGATADAQYTNIIDLAREEVEAANILTDR
jgi:hypothetical protein